MNNLRKQFEKEYINNVNTFDCRYSDQYVWWLEQKLSPSTVTDEQKNEILETAFRIHDDDDMRPIPNDAQIYRAANENIDSIWAGHGLGYYYHFVEGAKWMRSKLTPKMEEK